MCSCETRRISVGGSGWFLPFVNLNERFPLTELVSDSLWKQHTHEHAHTQAVEKFGFTGCSWCCSFPVSKSRSSWLVMDVLEDGSTTRVQFSNIAYDHPVISTWPLICETSDFAYWLKFNSLARIKPCLDGTKVLTLAALGDLRCLKCAFLGTTKTF